MSAQRKDHGLLQDADLYRRVLGYFRPDWVLIVVLFILSGVSVLLGLLQSWPLGIIIDAVLTEHPKTGWIYTLFLFALPKNKLGQVIGVALIGMGMKIVQDFLTGAKNMLTYRISNYGVMRVRDDLYARLGESPAADPGARRDGGDAMYRVEADAQGPQMVINVLMGAVLALLTFITTAVVMFDRSVSLTLFALLAAPPLVGLNFIFDKVLRRRTVSAKEIESHMVSVLSMPKESKEFHISAKGAADKWLGLNWAQEGYWFLVRTVFSFGGALVFGYGGYLVWRDQFAHPVADGMTIGTLAVFMDWLGKLWDPLTQLVGAGPNLQPGVAGTKRVFEVLDAEEPPEAPGAGKV